MPKLLLLELVIQQFILYCERQIYSEENEQQLNNNSIIMVRLTKRRRQNCFSDMMEINLRLIPCTLVGLLYVDYLKVPKIGREIISPVLEERKQQTGKHTVVIVK